ncbi:MAG: hypothetical protein H0Z34_16930 [Brevibacillus sp.]|nr:hypothetical protein [Brevibacillus sp.]
MENVYYLFVMLSAGLLLDTWGLGSMALCLSSISLTIVAYAVLRRRWTGAAYLIGD